MDGFWAVLSLRDCFRIKAMILGTLEMFGSSLGRQTRPPTCVEAPADAARPPGVEATLRAFQDFMDSQSFQNALIKE